LKDTSFLRFSFIETEHAAMQGISIREEKRKEEK
jgi:hypothetical protein